MTTLPIDSAAPLLAPVSGAEGAQGMPSTLFMWSLEVVVVLLGLAILLVVFRLLRGPTLPDRVVALDMIATLAAGAIAVYAVRENQPVFLFVAVVLALVMFVGTVAFAFYLEKGIRRKDGGEPDPDLPEVPGGPEAPPPPAPAGAEPGAAP
jgi:multicomponent Na+:H+ antiporter subunit F